MVVCAAMLFGGCVRGLEVGQVHARVRLWRYRVLVRDDAWVSVSHATHSAPHSAPHRTLSHQPSKTLTSRSTRKARVAASTPPDAVSPASPPPAIASVRSIPDENMRPLPDNTTHRHVASRGMICGMQRNGYVSNGCLSKSHTDTLRQEGEPAPCSVVAM
jgi:hypothetical protein